MQDIGRLKHCFEEVGFKKVVVENYGYLPFGFAWLRNRSIAERLLAKITPNSILVAHSNGPLLVDLMLEMGLKLSGAVLLNPALDADRALPPSVDWVHVYYNKNDQWTWLSKFIPFHRWGNQGQIGYTGNDPRYTQFDTETTAAPLQGHSGYWDEENLPVWCSILAKRTWDADVAYRNRQAGLS